MTRKKRKGLKGEKIARIRGGGGGGEEKATRRVSKEPYNQEKGEKKKRLFLKDVLKI